MRSETSTAIEGASVGVALDNHEPLTWRVHAHVDKWDDDQTRWVADKSGIVRPQAAAFDQFNVAPADTVDSHGNLLTTAGLTRLMTLLIGSGGQALTNTATRLGVGNSATAAAVGQTDLQASSGAGNRQFYVMDATFPSVSAGVMTAKSSFATGDANFVWNEWGLDIGTPTVSNGTTVNAVLFNRKVDSLGTKVSGTWALTVTVTIS